jgi:hypothetical protein
MVVAASTAAADSMEAVASTVEADAGKQQLS